MHQGPPKDGEPGGSLAGGNQPQPEPDDDDVHYTLYVFPFSLYSIMARFTISLGSQYHQGPRGLPRVAHKLVNLHRDEELQEWYLTTVNPKGQVPAMTAHRPGRPGFEAETDSLDISRLFCRLYFPGMVPGEHRPTIDDLLGKLHAIEGTSLTVKDPTEEQKVVIPNPKLEELLAREDISDSYRRALEYKKSYFNETIAYALRPEYVAKAKSQTAELLQQLLIIYHKHNGADGYVNVPWLFGPSIGPTILDAHATAYITRLEDAGQQGLVPKPLLSYARSIKALPAWDAVCHGRKTTWNLDYGHVHLLEDM